MNFFYKVDAYEKTFLSRLGRCPGDLQLLAVFFESVRRR